MCNRIHICLHSYWYNKNNNRYYPKLTEDVAAVCEYNPKYQTVPPPHLLAIHTGLSTIFFQSVKAEVLGDHLKRLQEVLDPIKTCDEDPLAVAGQLIDLESGLNGEPLTSDNVKRNIELTQILCENALLVDRLGAYLKMLFQTGIIRITRYVCATLKDESYSEYIKDMKLRMAVSQKKDIQEIMRTCVEPAIGEHVVCSIKQKEKFTIPSKAKGQVTKAVHSSEKRETQGTIDSTTTVSTVHTDYQSDKSRSSTLTDASSVQEEGFMLGGNGANNRRKSITSKHSSSKRDSKGSIHWVNGFPKLVHINSDGKPIAVRIETILGIDIPDKPNHSHHSDNPEESFIPPLDSIPDIPDGSDISKYSETVSIETSTKASSAKPEPSTTKSITPTDSERTITTSADIAKPSMSVGRNLAKRCGAFFRQLKAKCTPSPTTEKAPTRKLQKSDAAKLKHAIKSQTAQNPVDEISAANRYAFKTRLANNHHSRRNTAEEPSGPTAIYREVPNASKPTSISLVKKLWPSKVLRRITNSRPQK